MKTELLPPRDTWPSLCRRPAMNSSELQEKVRNILEKVRNEGDKALFSYAEEFDNTHLESLRVEYPELSQSEALIPESLKQSIRVAGANIEKFHKAQLINEMAVETAEGVKCWRKKLPVEKVGLYIPGGTAPLFSTVLMLAIPAKVAGCSEIVLCTPPSKDGTINPLILYAAYIAGVTNVFRAGGAQAIAAMAFGTKSIPKVDKIFGPGNQYVTMAKEMVQLDGIPIDMPAGPSEVLVIADETAEPAFVAADLISQAEHGTDSQVIFLTDDPDMITNVKSEVEKQVADLPRKHIASRSLGNSMAVLLKTLDECIDFSNLYAPEHLIIATGNPMYLAEKVRNAGSVFLGKFSCESAGDYATGTNHTLPTNGFARNYSGVSTDSFMKTISFQNVSPDGLKKLGPVIEQLAEAELLTGHKNAVTLRLNYLKNV